MSWKRIKYVIVKKSQWKILYLLLSQNLFDPGASYVMGRNYICHG